MALVCHTSWVTQVWSVFVTPAHSLVVRPAAANQHSTSTYLLLSQVLLAAVAACWQRHRSGSCQAKKTCCVLVCCVDKQLQC
jgi:hypothetical protein